MFSDLKYPGYFILIFLSLCSKFALSQDYHAVKSNAEFFFYDSTSRNIIAIRIDSVKKIGNDIHYYNFKQIRQTDYGCYNIAGASWLGDEVIEKPDGTFEFVFFPFSPPDSATIYRISTHSGINHPWKFYTYNIANQYIEANVSEIKRMNFLGLTDSVKVITLTRKHVSGQIITDPVNSQTLFLSKTYGLIRLPKFDIISPTNSYYLFYNLAGKTNPETGITNVRTLKIFDFEKGDEFHTVYYNRWHSIPYPETTISTINRVLQRITYPTSDSVTYLIEQCWSKCYKYSATQTTYTHRFDTIILTYSILRTPWLETEPFETVLPNSKNPWVTFNKMGFLEDPVLPFKNYAYKSEDPLLAYSKYNNCYTRLMLDGCGGIYYYFKGLGGPFYHCDFMGEIYNNLPKYFKKGNETWGAPLSCDSLVQVGLPESVQIQNCTISPNPTSGIFTLTSPSNIQFPCKMELFNSSGRVITHFTITENIQSVDIRDLPAGLYLYILSTSKGKAFKGKIIKQ